MDLNPSHLYSLLWQEVIRRDWMFKLVGRETFAVGSANTKATIVIEAVGGFAYEYTLQVGGTSLQKFSANRAQTTKTWLFKVDGQDCRIVLGEQELANGVYAGDTLTEGVSCSD